MLCLYTCVYIECVASCVYTFADTCIYICSHIHVDFMYIAIGSAVGTTSGGTTPKNPLSQKERQL